MMKRKCARGNALPKELIFLFLAVSITLLGDSSLYVLLPIHASSIGVPLGMVGILLSANRFVRLFTNYAVSSLHVRLGSRFMVTISVLLAALTTLIYGLPAGVAALFLSRVAWGFCWSTLRFESMDSIARDTDVNNRGRAAGLFHSISRIGSLSALLIGGVLVEWAGYRRTFVVFALMTLLGGMAMVLLWKQSPGESRQHDLTDKSAELAESADAQPVVCSQPAGLLSDRTLSVSRPYCYALTLLNGWIGSGLLITTVGYIMMLKFGQQLSILGLTIGISMAASFITSSNWFYSIFLSVVFGRLSDRYGRIRVLTLTGMVLIVSLFVIAYSPWLTLYLLAATVSFAAAVALHAILTAVTIDHHCRENGSRVIAHQTTFNDLGSALGALFGLLLVVWIGYKMTYTITFSILAIMVLSLHPVIRNRLHPST